MGKDWIESFGKVEKVEGRSRKSIVDQKGEI